LDSSYILAIYYEYINIRVEDILNIRKKRINKRPFSRPF
jgi:hypothetical protein